MHLHSDHRSSSFLDQINNWGATVLTSGREALLEFLCALQAAISSSTRARYPSSMPTLLIQTNAPGNGVDNSDILKALSTAVAQTVGKPEQWVMVSLTTNKPMSYSGNEAACAYGELISIGAIGGEKNKTISAAVAEVLESKLNIDPARFYLKFVDVARSDFGWNGSTF